MAFGPTISTSMTRISTQFSSVLYYFCSLFACILSLVYQEMYVPLLLIPGGLTCLHINDYSRWQIHCSSKQISGRFVSKHVEKIGS